jgi:hypothetical protein
LADGKMGTTNSRRRLVEHHRHAAGGKMGTTNSGRRFLQRECNRLSWRPKAATATGLFHGDKTTSYMTILGAHAYCTDSIVLFLGDNGAM